MWERRAPLCPEHVADLVGQGFRVKVQPCSRRVFPDDAYRAAGAEVENDLSDCGLVLGVKQVPVDNLLPDRSYMFFSHTIKAQPENMPLLDACRDRNIKLFDYECLLEQSTEASRGKRLVAFGKYAGIVGFVDILQGLGQQLLASGFSTPFIHSPQCFMFGSLEEAKARVKALGEEISRDGLPEGIGPLVFAFVGGGNVTKGAQEVFECLPHRMVEPEELEDLVRHGDRHEARHMLYGTYVQQHHLVRRISDHGFDKVEYYAHPDRYEPVFHKTVAPYTSVLVNGIYWDQRFPRLITSGQLQQLAREQQDTDQGLRLRAVADVTCDIDGSVEMLTRATDMSTPFYEWDALNGRESARIGQAAAGVVMLGVDILPTALPREASKHFGDALLPLLPPLLTQDPAGVDLPAELKNARIAARGALEPNFKYIERLRAMLAAEEPESFSGPWKKVFVKGHLFDSGFINQVFDVIEKRGGDFEVGDIVVVPNLEDSRRVSQIVLSISAPSAEVLEDIDRRLHSLAEVMETAEAVIEQLPHSSHSSSAGSSPTFSSPTTETAATTPQRAGDNVTVEGTPKHVVLLGAGLVAAPLVEYLTDPSRTTRRQVTIVSQLEEEAAALAGQVPEGAARAIALGVEKEEDREALGSLIREGDVVVSLVPPPLHAGVAEHCIQAGTHLVTASYVSDAMRGLDKAAQEKGVLLLNEMGLDPGMDHMSAMKVIHEAQAQGAQVTSFRSLCGGLCSPDCLDPEDPLQYKFSWSPAGVFSAAMSPARFLQDGIVVEQDGPTKLSHAQPFQGWKSLNLEAIPNRDSLIYGDLYGIEESAQTILRGTLRYHGWCSLVHSFHELGLLEADVVQETGGTWGGLLAKLAERRGFPSAKALLEASVGAAEADKTLDALAWLGAGPNDALETPRGCAARPLDAFVQVLTQKLSLGPTDKDLVLMQHDFEFMWPDGTASGLRSSFIAAGDERHTAMARTVGVTAAIGADLVLDGVLDQRRGVVTPMSADIYEPSLRLLEDQGFVFKEDPYDLRP
uniref:Saccharopine dehydrogenase (NAD(+), L-glutamate-forming) n=1 Tax=Rhizochromulina marina TaxID=1034831 RepID=A0A7S2SNY8_9STRA|mmetsp:Transcript_33282/g.96451  ORF Transcript_33282/g.96451 Transcript_33282/m.96451 type:complete len:1027 (+) Transcript_33282:1-3081(+)